MMQKMKAFMRSPASTTLLFFLAALLLLGSAVGSARAALTYFSENYNSRVEMDHVGVSLIENGEVISEDNGEVATLFDGMIEEGESFQVGKPYSEKIAVKNSGEIDEFVRVVVYRYWVDEGTDEKRLDLDPEYIKINYLDGKWLLDANASTDERDILYYNSLLPAGETTDDLCDSIMVDSELMKFVTEEREDVDDTHTIITRTYLYDGVEFRIEIEADAVQSHNAQNAIKSAWGRGVTVNGTTLSLEG